MFRAFDGIIQIMSDQGKIHQGEIDRAGTTAAEAGEESASVQRRRLAAVWLTAGSAVAFMVGGVWYSSIVRVGGLPPGGDMTGHAGAAEWLRTLPWWDWRGWSDWFYGGQAIGVNYPPLGHFWMRFTHPVHGQMAAVALGLLVLLPWGALRLARAVGYSPRRQRVAVGAVLVMTAAAGSMHWVLSGFHAVWTGFGSWPAMLSTVVGLFTAAWAARAHRPVRAGVVAGVALLCNATLIPGWIVMWSVLLATSGASFRQGVRWAVTAGAAGLAVSGWWLVPFLDSWERLVRWEVRLFQALNYGGVYQEVVLIALGLGVGLAGRRSGPARRLAVAAGAAVLATLLADLGGWLRPERWLGGAMLVGAMACAGLAAQTPAFSPTDRLRPVWKLHIALGLMFFFAVTPLIEVVALAVGLFLLPPRSWAWIGALAWGAIFFWGGVWGFLGGQPADAPESPVGLAAKQSGPHAAGLVYLNSKTVTPNGLLECPWNHPWADTASTDGRIRPLLGLYQETSSAAEFINIDFLAEVILIGGSGPPHWREAWEDAGRPAVRGGLAAAESLGARWYVSCDEDGDVALTDLPGVLATGVAVDVHPSEEAWHRAAVRWWLPIVTDLLAEPQSWEPVPVWSEDDGGRPARQAAAGVWLRAEGDRLTVGAAAAGWAWLRVPWDPYWSAPAGAAVYKGGPGHLVVWIPEGETELVWRVPTGVDAAAAAVTGAAGLTALVMAAGNRRSRRRGDGLDPDRPRPFRAAVGLYADTVDEFLRTVGRWTRSAGRASKAAAARCRVGPR